MALLKLLQKNLAPDKAKNIKEVYMYMRKKTFFEKTLKNIRENVEFARLKYKDSSPKPKFRCKKIIMKLYSIKITS